MRPDQSSATAENIALLRAHEALQPGHERICHDPFAVRFLPGPLFDAPDRSARMRETISAWEARFPGVCNAILARTRFVDDCLAEAIRLGIRQLVILGAGYDTRALRFDALRNAVSVFELDHPNTQQRKLDRMERRIGLDLAHVRYVPIDFTRDSLADKLFAAGYTAALKTLFIWEGVTYYIPATAVDHTLQCIRRHATCRSRVVFDYFPPSVADGTSRLDEARALREGLGRLGERIVFGIRPDQIDLFMRQHGFSVLRNLTRADYFDFYFKGENRKRTVSEMFGFVLAEA